MSRVPERLTIAVYHNLHSGGAKRTTDEITRRLAERHLVDLYTPSEASVARETRDAVRHVYVLPFSAARTLGHPFGRVNYGIRLLELRRLDRVQHDIARAIDTRGYDIVYVHPCQVMQSPSLLSYLRTPSVYHSREPLREVYEPEVPRPYTERSGFKRILDRLDPMPAMLDRRRIALDRAAARAATRVLTASAFTRDAMARIYGLEAAVCYHGVDATRFCPAAVARNGILAVGALTPRKGLDLIVRGIGLLPDAIRPPLTIVSNYQEPRERAHIERLAAAHRVRLTCLQAVTDEVLIDHYCRARLVAYTPVREPFGLVPLEAMACEAPVIGVAEGGVCETIEDGRTGFLIDRHPQQFADAAERLLRDPALAAACGAEGRRSVLARWTWEASMRQLDSHLKDCVEK